MLPQHLDKFLCKMEPEKDSVEHLEEDDFDAAKRQDETLQEHGEIDIHDQKHNKKLNRRLDLRVLPLCCWVYLLNFLDRGKLRPLHSPCNLCGIRAESLQETSATPEYSTKKQETTCSAIQASRHTATL